MFNFVFVKFAGVSIMYGILHCVAFFNIIAFNVFHWYFCRFLLTNCFITYLYTTTYQNVDDEEYGGMTEILKEGMMSSFATFMVSKS